MSTLRPAKFVYVLQHEYTEAYELVYVMQHEYTEAGLSFHGLKNKDCAVAEALRSATKEADQVVHLAIFSKHQSGSAEYIDTAPFVCQNVSSTKEGQPTVLVVCL